MQIILNQSEVEAAVQAYVDDQINLAGDINIVINADGTASVGINEEVHEDTPPVVEKQKRTRRTRNPAEAKHVPVEAKAELQTSDGGQKETTTSVTEPDAASQEVAEEAAVQEKVQEKAVETTAAKPSLFANLKR